VSTSRQKAARDPHLLQFTTSFLTLKKDYWETQ